MSKRVLITGGAGFIGSHLVEECQSRGWKVAVIDKADGSERPNPLREVPGDWRHITGDVADYRNLQSAYVAAQRPSEGSDWTAGYPDTYQPTIGFDYIFHLAAEPYVPKSFEEPSLFLDVNVRGTLNVLNLASRIKADRVLIVSSSEVYGGVPHGTALTEESQLNPLSTYGVSKMAADRLAYSRFRETGVPAIIFRPFNCYGPRITQTYVIPDIIAQAHRRSVIRLGNTQSVRDFSYVTDTVKAMVATLEWGTPGETYHFGSGSTFTVENVVELVGAIMGKKLAIEVRQHRMRPADVTWLKADITKYLDLLQANDRVADRDLLIDFRTGLARTIEWFQKSGEHWYYNMPKLEPATAA